MCVCIFKKEIELSQSPLKLRENRKEKEHLRGSHFDISIPAAKALSDKAVNVLISSQFV